MSNQNGEMSRTNRNKVTISGVLENEFKYSHTTNSGRNFYKNTLRVKNGRKEEQIAIIASEDLIYNMYRIRNKPVVVNGSIETCKVVVSKEKESNDVIIVAEQIEFCKEEKEENLIFLEGKIKSKPIRQENISYKTCFVFLSAHMRKRWINNIPCKFYGEEVNRIKRIPIGTRVRLIGKIGFQKKLKLLEDGNVQVIVVHHVAVLKFDVLKK